jgi:energy-coupling factor transport system ATP-binding protein
MIELRNVSVNYGSTKILGDVSLSVNKGEIIAIMGPNASGKSTLLKVMSALIIPGSGDCIVEGKNTRDRPFNARRLAGMVFQDPEDQIVARRVEDDVAFGPKNIGYTPDEAVKKAREALKIVGLGGMSGKSVHSLSGGQKQLLAIASVLAMEPSYLMMDEPSSLLDGDGTRYIRQIIKKLKERGLGIVIVTHDPAEALMADGMIVLDKGRIVARGSPYSVFLESVFLENIGVDVPDRIKLSKRLEQDGIDHHFYLDEAV